MTSSLLIGFVGLVTGQFCMRSVFGWASLFYFAQEQLAVLGQPVRKMRVVKLVLCQSFFHSGPWLLATVTFFAYEIRAKPWATPFLLGLFGGVAYMCVVTWKTLTRFRRATPPAESICRAPTQPPSVSSAHR
jgi:hypothetical protein